MWHIDMWHIDMWLDKPNDEYVKFQGYAIIYEKCLLPGKRIHKQIKKKW